MSCILNECKDIALSGVKYACTGYTCRAEGQQGLPFFTNFSLFTCLEKQYLQADLRIVVVAQLT